MKATAWARIVILSLSAVALPIYAASPGLYFGGQGGWGNVHDSGISEQNMGNLITSALDGSNFNINSFNGTTSKSGLAGRVFAGFQWGCFAALELGWSKFSSLPVKATAGGRDVTEDAPFRASTSGTLKITAVDLVAKGILPLRYNLSLYGKLGAVDLMGVSNSSAVVTVEGVPNASDNENDNTNRVFPTFGVGIAWAVRPDIEWDLSYTRIQKVGHSEELGSVDFVAIGLSFHLDQWGVYT